MDSKPTNPHCTRKLPKSNTKTRQMVKACLLLTPYQSKNLQPTKSETQKSEDINNKEDITFKEKMNNIPVKSDNRPKSPLWKCLQTSFNLQVTAFPATYSLQL
jgi:hypothetical protein